MSRFGPCMCGATDCPSCGPAQGYTVVRVWDSRRNAWKWVNPEDDEEVEDEDELPPWEPEKKAAFEDYWRRAFNGKGTT